MSCAKCVLKHFNKSRRPLFKRGKKHSERLRQKRQTQNPWMVKQPSKSKVFVVVARLPPHLAKGAACAFEEEPNAGQGNIAPASIYQSQAFREAFERIWNSQFERKLSKLLQLPRFSQKKTPQNVNKKKSFLQQNPPTTLVSGKCTEVERMEIIIPTQITQCGETLTTFLSQLAQNVNGKVINTELPTSQIQPEEESRSNGFGRSECCEPKTVQAQKVALKIPCKYFHDQVRRVIRIEITLQGATFHINSLTS